MKNNTVTYNQMEKQDGKLKAVETHQLKQSEMTSDCWLVQFRGLKACCNCDFYKSENCGGGETLTRILLNKINVAPLELHLIGEYWTENPEGTFYGLLEHLRNNEIMGGLVRLEKEYSKLIEQELARQVENMESKNTMVLETRFKFDDIINKGSVVEKSGYHKPNQRGFGKSCNCRGLTKSGGAYRDMVIDLNDNIRIYYLHQNPIVARTPEHYVLSDCGWRTSLTKDRINRILGYSQGNIFSEGNFWYLRLPKPKRAGAGAIDYRRFYSGIKVKRYNKYDKDKIFS